MYPPLRPRRRPISRFVVANPTPPTLIVDGGTVPTENRGAPWFDDGNTILVAEETAFKVYMGLLAKHSVVLKEMLARPETTACPERLEDCIVIKLEDPPWNLSNLLAAMHNGCGRTLALESKDDFAELVSTMRLAEKYKCEYIRAWALSSLQVAYPDHLSDFDTAWKGGIGFTDAAEAVRFARETSAFALLPAAMVRLASSNFINKRPIGAYYPPRIIPAPDVQHLVLLMEHDRLTNQRIMRAIQSRSHGEIWLSNCDRVSSRRENCRRKFTSMFHLGAEILVLSEYPISCIDFVDIVEKAIVSPESDICRGKCTGVWGMG